MVVEGGMQYQHNPLPGIPRSPAPQQQARPQGWLSRRTIVRAGAGLAVLALVAVLVGVLLPGNGFKAEKKAAPAATGFATKSISRAQVQPVQNATTIYDMLERVAAPTPAPNTAAAAAVTGQFVGATDKAEEEEGGYGAEETTDDPDDDMGTDDDYNEFGGFGGIAAPNPNTYPGFNSIVTATWAAWGGSAAQICYATTGKELRKMCESETCTVVVLTRSSQKEYTLAKSVTVRGRKIVLGNPLDMPVVNAYDHHIGRAFLVAEGAYLDMRFVHIVRAYGDKLAENLKLIAGACVTAMPGSTFIATGCIFRTETQDINQYLYDVEVSVNGLMYRVFGGFVLQLGGYMQLNGCVMLTFRPYGNPYLDNGILGRDACVVAGIMNLIGTHDVTIQAYSASVAVGTVAAVLGGALTWTGGAIVSILGLQNQFGAGHVLFTGGGATIGVGLQYVTVCGALNRGGFGSFTTGGGVAIYIGFHMVRAWGVAAVYNYGHTLATGAGVTHFIGCSVVSAVHQWFFVGNGGTAAQGTGDMYVLGTSQARTVVCQSNFGLGFFWSNGSGVTKLIGCPVAAAQVVRALIGLGSESYTGAGIVIAIGTARALTQVVAFFGGLGTYMYLGAGGMALVGTRYVTRRLVEFPPSAVAPGFVVGGNAITAKTAAKGPKWLTNRHRNLLTSMSHTLAPSTHQEEQAERELFWGDDDGQALGTTTSTEPTMTSRPTSTATTIVTTLDETSAPSAAPTLAPTVTATAAATAPPSAVTVTTPPSAVTVTAPPSATPIKTPTTTPAPTVPATAASTATASKDPLLSYTNSVFMVANVFKESKILRKNAEPSNTTAMAERTGLLKNYPTFQRMSAAMDKIFDAPVPARQGLHFARTNPSRCLVASMNPEPASAWFLNGSSECQAIDLNVSSSEPMDHVVAAQEAADPPLPWVSRMLPYAEALRRDPQGKAPLPNTGIITSTVHFSCHGSTGSKCVDDGFLKEVLLGLFGPQGDGDYSVSVATQDVPLKYSNHLKNLFRFDYKAQQGTSDSACPLTTTYKVYTTSHHEDLQKLLTDRWGVLDTNEAPLYKMLNKTLVESGSPVRICGLDVKKDWAFSVPPMERSPGYRPVNSRIIWPSIELTDGVSLTPVRSLAAATTYQIHVYNFPQDHSIKIDLVRGIGNNVVELTTIADFQDGGYMTLNWEVAGTPSGSGMRCYLRATDTAVPALDAKSQSFTC